MKAAINGLKHPKTSRIQKDVALSEGIHYGQWWIGNSSVSVSGENTNDIITNQATIICDF